MEPTLSILALVAPLCLAFVWAWSRRPNPGTRAGLGAARLATGLSLGVAVLILAAVLVAGSRTSPTLGVGDLGLSLRLDLLSATMFTLVSFVGLVVVRYSRSYLEGDARRGDFVGRLCMALSAVTVLVLAGNLAQLVVAWVAASFALHRLLVFFADRPRAVIAGRMLRVTGRLQRAHSVTHVLAEEIEDMSHMLDLLVTGEALPPPG